MGKLCVEFQQVPTAGLKSAFQIFKIEIWRQTTLYCNERIRIC